MSKPKFYNAWFCPFAQRVWITFLYKGIDFEYIEQDPFNKSPEWLAINPMGKVPALIHNEKPLYESAILMEYLEDKWPDTEKILPVDPYDKAFVRIWSDYTSRIVVPPFYALLRNTTKEEQDETTKKLLSGLKELFQHAKDDGPFFMGKSFGMVDMLLAPFANRYGNVLKHYRGFSVPETKEYARYHTWWKAVQEIEVFKKTLQDDDKLIEVYGKYVK